MEPSLRTQVHAAADDALGSSDTCDLLDRLRRRETSAQELRAAAEARLRSVNPSLNAIVHLVGGESIPAATASAPFAGVPLPVKDTDDIAGYPTYWGSRAVAGTPAQRNSPFVEQLLALGFSPLAKTTLPEFGLTATTQSIRFGDTRNPWDLTRIAGGSSGGSAALVAAGVTTIAHTNDGGGSTRIPASACGLVGLKPSRGRLVDRPEIARAPVRLPVQGVVTRTVRDTALFYAAAERLYADPSLPAIGHVTEPIRERLRIAVVGDGLAGIRLHEQNLAALGRTATLLEGLGHRVEYVANPFPEQLARDFLRYWALQGYFLKHSGRLAFGPGFEPGRTDSFTDGLAAMFTAHWAQMPASIRRLRTAGAATLPLFERFDVVLSATLGQPLPTLASLSPELPFRPRMLRLMRLVTTTPLDNVTGNPAISLPLAHDDDGLPLGMQFSAAMGQEALLLGLALELEAAVSWPQHPVRV